MTVRSAQTPLFDASFRRSLCELLEWRRDVRRFRTNPVDRTLLETLLHQAGRAPSVGNSQPWRFVIVDDAARRARIRALFEGANAAARTAYTGERWELYGKLKLAGLDDAPVQLAVCCDESTNQGQGLGRRSMPETLRYSVVAAIHTLWLLARAHGLGMGWVSIIEPARVLSVLNVPDHWSLIGYLCIGYPLLEHQEPELERAGWQGRRACSILRR